MTDLQLTADIILNEGQLDARLQAIADESRARLARAGEIGLRVDNVAAVQEQLGMVEKTMTTIKTIAGAGLVGGAFLGLHSVYTTAQELNNAQTLLTHIDGSASAAQKQVAALNQLAIRTPLSLQNVLTANQYLALAQKQMLAVGNQQKINTTAMITSLGDVAYSLNQGGQGVNNSAKALLEAVEQGGIYGSLQRMLRSDIPNYKGIIAQQLWGSTSDASKVTADVLHQQRAVNALIEALNEGKVGDGIAGSMAAANNSLKGTVQRTMENVDSSLGMALNKAAPGIEKFLNNVDTGFTDLAHVIGPVATVIGKIPKPLMDVGQALLLLKVAGPIFNGLRTQSEGFINIWRGGGIANVKARVSDLTSGAKLASASMRGQVAQARAAISEDSAAVQAYLSDQIRTQDQLIVDTKRMVDSQQGAYNEMSAFGKTFSAEQRESIDGIRTQYAALDEAMANVVTMNERLAEAQATGAHPDVIAEMDAEYKGLVTTVNTAAADVNEAMAKMGLTTREEFQKIANATSSEYMTQMQYALTVNKNAANETIVEAENAIMRLQTTARQAAAVYAEFLMALRRGALSATLASAGQAKGLYMGPITKGPSSAVTDTANTGLQTEASAAVAAAASKAAAATGDEADAIKAAGSAAAAASEEMDLQAAANMKVTETSEAAAAATKGQAAANTEAGASAALYSSRVSGLNVKNAVAMGGFIALTTTAAALSPHLAKGGEEAQKFGSALDGAATGAGIGMFIGPEAAAVGAGIGGLIGWLRKAQDQANATAQSLDDLYTTIAGDHPGSRSQNKSVSTAISMALTSDDLSKLGLTYQQIDTYVQDATQHGKAFWEAMTPDDRHVAAARAFATGLQIPGFSGDNDEYQKLKSVIDSITGAEGKAKNAAEKLAQQMREAGIPAAHQLTEKITEQRDAMTAMNTAASDSKAILQGVKDKTLSTAQAQVTARGNILDLVNTYKGLSNQERNNTGVSVATARAIFEVGTYAGFTKNQIATMGATLMGIPKSTFIGFATNAPAIAREIAQLVAEMKAANAHTNTVGASTGEIPLSGPMKNWQLQLTHLKAQQAKDYANLSVTSTGGAGLANFPDPSSVAPSGGSGGSGGGGGGGSHANAAKAAKQHLQTLQSARKTIDSMNNAWVKQVNGDWNALMKSSFGGDLKSVRQDYSKLAQGIQSDISSLKSKMKDASAGAKRAYEAEIHTLAQQEAQILRTSKATENYAEKIAAVNKQITAAKADLAQLTQAEAQQKSATLDQVATLGSLSGLTSAEQMLKVLQAASATTKTFQANLGRLKADVADGLLSQQAWDQLAALGPGSSSLIASLANASPAMLSQINSQANTLTDAGNKLGDYVSTGMYGAGVTAATSYLGGFAKTLKGYEKALNSAGVKDISKIIGIIDKGYKTPKSYSQDEPGSGSSSSVTLSAAQLQALSAAIEHGTKKAFVDALKQAQRSGGVLL